MPLTRQAKTLTTNQRASLLTYVEQTAYAPARNVLIVRLSYEVWLRAKEIACIRWRMLTDAGGALVDELRLEDRASKGHSGRVLRVPSTTYAALVRLFDEDPPRTLEDFVLRFRKDSRDPIIRSHAVQALFRGWYRGLGFFGATSHSGRRTGITFAARHLGPGLSLKDVQLRAGHRHITTTQRYIDPNPEADLQLATLSMIRPVMVKAGLTPIAAPKRRRA